jgi:hypothetical protein
MSGYCAALRKSTSYLHFEISAAFTTDFVIGSLFARRVRSTMEYVAAAQEVVCACGRFRSLIIL